MYQALIGSEAYQSMLELRNIVVAWGQFGNFQGYDQAQFIEIYDTIHTDLRSLETKALDDVMAIIDEKTTEFGRITFRFCGGHWLPSWRRSLLRDW